jgi:autotransporter-associated beta strand protein
MTITQHLSSSLLHTGIKKIIPSHLRLFPPPYFPVAAILMLSLAAAGTAFAGSATWNLNATGLWNNAGNWTPPTVPNGPADTATFGVSNSTDIGNDSTGDIEVNGIVFNTGASAFTISFGNASFFHAFTISGVGITNNSGITQNFVIEDFGEAATMIFKNSATAGDQTVFTLASNPCCGSMFVEFHDTSTAGNATLIANSGDFILFSGDSTGGTARVEVFGGGNLDISAHNAPGVTVGSIEGTGAVFLGANNLTVGSNNLSRMFSGVIQDGGSLTKIGTGTLALTGTNTYSGGTTIEGGKLVVNNMSGSGTGSGAVQVNAGTLVGRGIIAGAVTVGTGSGASAVMAPGRRELKPGTLTIQSTLTFNSDATYEVSLNTNDAIADQVVANGVIISGARFSLVDHGRFALTQGTVFTVIDNDSGTPIAGRFANLADGSIFTKHGNTFQASYEGGDGNDLTLTVMP